MIGGRGSRRSRRKEGSRDNGQRGSRPASNSIGGAANEWYFIARQEKWPPTWGHFFRFVLTAATYAFDDGFDRIAVS